MKFVLPLPPNIGNTTYYHWRQKQRARKRYYFKCDQLQLLRYVPGPPDRPFPKARADITLYVHQIMDHDNLVARTKWCRDWLVTRGYIVDDRPANLTATVSQGVDRKHQRVEITLEAA